MIFECRQVRSVDETGVVRSIGVAWTEPRWFIESVIYGFSCTALLVGFATTAFGLVGLQPVVICVGAGILWFAWEALQTVITFAGRRRELRFMRNGNVYAPMGCSTWQRKGRYLAWHHFGITSIETEKQQPAGPAAAEYTHGVRMFFRSGEIARVSRNLHEDDALMLSVQLMTALTALRDDMASNAHGWAVDAQGPQGSAAGRRRPGWSI